MKRTTKLTSVVLGLTTALALTGCGGQQDRAAAGAGADESSCDAGEGRAIAMGQAPDEVKAAASEVTGTVDDDGLASVLEGLLVRT